MLRRISSGRAINPPGTTVNTGGGGIPKKTASAPAAVADVHGYQAVTAAVLKALKGEEVLAWTAGHERRDSAADRKRLLRKGPAPGFPALLVVTQARRNPTFRLHLLAENKGGACGGASTRPRSWTLTDLRLVDGLGFPVKIARDFALTFAGSPRPLYWRCDSSEYRAKFLWTLLQICAGKLPGKAPPSQRLSLLELQQFANDVQLKPLKRKSDTDAEKRPPKSPPPQRVLRTTSEPQAGALHDLVIRAEAERNNNDNNRMSMDGPPVARPPAEKGERDLSVYELAFALAARRVGARPPIFKRSRPQSPIAAVKSNLDESNNNNGVDGNDNGNGNNDRQKTTHFDNSTTDQTSGVPVRKVTDNGYPPQVPRQRSMGGNNDGGANIGVGMQRITRPKDKKLPDVRAPVSLCDGRICDGASPTEMLVARCKAQAERRQYRLEDRDAEDLEYALNGFLDSNNINRDMSQSVPDLSVFESWTRTKMHEIETQNMKETVSIEQAPACGFSVDGYRSMLIDSVSAAESWLKPTAAHLAPYSVLIEDIRGRVRMLDRHRAHVVQLKELLEEVLDPRVGTAEEEEKENRLEEALRIVADSNIGNTTTTATTASPSGTISDTNIPLVDGEDPFTNCNIKGSPMQALSWTSAISARSPGV